MSEPEPETNLVKEEDLPGESAESEYVEDVPPIAAGLNLHYFAPSSSSSSNSGNGDSEDDHDNNEEELGNECYNYDEQCESTDSNQQSHENHEEGDGEWTYEVAEMKNGGHCSDMADPGPTDWNQADSSRGQWEMSQDGSENMDCTNDGDGDKGDEEETPTDDKSEEKNKTFKIFVSNLPPGLEKSVLQELFQKYGEVKECELFVKNYAFVHMTSEEDGKRALEELDGFEIQGCKLNVKRSRPMKGMKKNARVDLVCGTFKLYIGFLPDGATKEYVTKLLEPFGRVVELEIHKANSAFVHMETEEGGQNAINALNGKKLPDEPDSEKSLLVAVSRKAGTPALPTTKLKVTNVCWSLTANELRQLFMPYGLVTRVNIFKKVLKNTSARTALVYLEQFGNIRSAIKDLNGKEVNDKKIQVEAFFGNEEDLDPPSEREPKNLMKIRTAAPISNYRNQKFENPTYPFQVPRNAPMPMPTRRLMPMPSQQDLWCPPAPPPPVMHPSGMRLIPMPSKEDLYPFGAGQGGRPPPLMSQQPFCAMNNSYDYDSSYDEVLSDGFGGGYSNYNNEDNYRQYDDSSFGPPPRKIPKNKKNPRRHGNAASGGGNQFPELPSSDEFPKAPPSLMSLQAQDHTDYDYSADLPLSSFSDFSAANNVQQDFSGDDSLPTSSLNAVPFDYTKMSNKKRNFNNFSNHPSFNQFSNQPRSSNSFNNSRGGRGGNAFRGNGRGGGGGNKKGKSRRPGLGTSQQLKKFANQSGQSCAGIAQIAQQPEASSSSSTSTSTEHQSQSDSTAGTSNSPYAPYYFQQNWNVKNKKPYRKPSAREVKEAEEEQKRQYADFLKQKPWLYQAIPGTVKRVQQ